MANYMDYIPNILKEVREFKAIGESEQPQLNLIYEAIESVMSNQFIETAMEYGVARMEKVVRIIPKATDTLEERKFRLLTKYNEDTPYTMKKLKEVLNNLCGKTGYSLVINNNQFLLQVKVALTSKKNKLAVEEFLEGIVPMNMIFEVTLLYNQHQQLKTYTHETLRVLTHFQLREEVLP
ncbi:MAG: putative phage tail protein [Anaerotignaceae bacterium]